MWYTGNSLPNNKILDWSKLKELANDKINVTEKVKFGFGQNRKHCGKRRKCCLPVFPPFPTMFSEGPFLRVVKSRDYVVQSSSYTALLNWLNNYNYTY